MVAQVLSQCKLTFQGGLVEAKITTPRVHSLNEYESTKQAIQHYSPKSRLTLLKMFKKLDLKADFGVFITLTYPQWYPCPKRAKDQLRAFFERIRRRTKGEGVWGVWRMEEQQRGAPHFHLLLFGLPFVDTETVQGWWSEITGNLELPFTRIEGMHSARQAMHYVSKYVSKHGVSRGFNAPPYLHALLKSLATLALLRQLKIEHLVCLHVALLMRTSDAWQPEDEYLPGRFWGVYEGQHRAWHVAHVYTFPLSDRAVKAFHTFRRAARRCYNRISKHTLTGFSLFVEDNAQWAALFEMTYADSHHPSGCNTSKRDLTSKATFKTR